MGVGAVEVGEEKVFPYKISRKDDVLVNGISCGRIFASIASVVKLEEYRILLNHTTLEVILKLYVGV